MYITYLLIGVTVAVSLYAFKERSVLAKLIMNPYQISKNKQYYRFASSGFIHNDHMHLIFNMFSLYFFGRAVEMIFGIIFGELAVVYFIGLYLLGIIVSDIPTFLKNKNNPRYNSLGASGGVAAVIFAFILFSPLDKICIYFALCIPGFILGTLYVVFSWYQGRKSNDNINHDAHLYGALFGLIYCIIVYPRSLSIFWDEIRTWEYFQF
jgi:membrane associated rhomboid family serine protease